mmetsp:Transcript_141341/g.439298  ORF Transcript_141341/g.439298 Transcript_141341/m.439298 type:complete len:216 (-) Transcript_141341:1584-2231(-)
MGHLAGGSHLAAALHAPAASQRPPALPRRELGEDHARAKPHGLVMGELGLPQLGALQGSRAHVPQPLDHIYGLPPRGRGPGAHEPEAGAGLLVQPHHRLADGPQRKDAGACRREALRGSAEACDEDDQGPLANMEVHVLRCHSLLRGAPADRRQPRGRPGRAGLLHRRPRSIQHGVDPSGRQRICLPTLHGMWNGKPDKASNAVLQDSRLPPVWD